MPAHAPDMERRPAEEEQEGSGSRARKRPRWDDDSGDAATSNGVNGASTSQAAGSSTGATADALLKAKASLANAGDIKAKLAALRAAKAAREAGKAGAPAAAAPAPAAAAVRPAAPAAVPRQTDAAAMPPPAARPFRAAPLRLDAEGREIDEFGSPVIRPAEPTSSLKINQRKPGSVPEEPGPQIDPERFQDPEMHVSRGGDRRKRANFSFVQEGRLQKQAELGRLRAQYGDEAVKALKKREAEERRTAKQATMDVNQIPLGVKAEEPAEALEPIPDIEWWDVRICTDGATYDSMAAAAQGEECLLRDKITALVQHPVPVEPPAEMAPPPPRPLVLTKKETRKLRKQRREEREKEKQDLIRQGLLEPPPPKVKISNLMRVLGEEATMDPTAIEQTVRSQMAERSQAHEDRNEARKLTPAERREKKTAKLVGELGPETLVSVYRVESLAKPQHRFKVDVNAGENHMTGAAVIADDFCLVIVEGGAKSQKRYSKLMLRRIDWAADDDDDEARGPSEPPKKQNGCRLVWEGAVKEPAFQRFSVEVCRTEAAAQKLLADKGLAHYWDLAVQAGSADE